MPNLVINLPEEMARSRAEPAPELDAYDPAEFCRRHMISRPYLYLLWRQGKGPKYFQLGAKRLISKEAALAWRLEREAVTTAAATEPVA